MNRFCRSLVIVGATIAFTITAAPSFAQTSGREVHITGVQDDDLYLAGARISIDADVRGDVNAAGGRVRIGGNITGDIGAGGGLVTVTGTVGDDVRVGGGQVDVDAKIDGDLVAVAMSVGVQSGTVVAGNAILSGGEVSVAGRVDGNLSTAGGSVLISGDIGGDVEIAGGEIEILSGATIGGNLSYLSAREATVEADAVINGEITRRTRAQDSDGSTSVALLIGGGFSLAWLAGFVATGTLLLTVFPESLRTATGNIQNAVWRSLGYGLLIIFAIPAAILFCFVIVIGIPLAVTLAAPYGAALFVAYLTTAFWVGDHGLRMVGRSDTPHRGWRILSLLSALILLGVVGWIPIIGWLVTFFALALALGLGAWAIEALSGRASNSVA